MNKPVISILNMKNGVGCSTLAWNIAHTLELDLYEHDKALHSYFASKRTESVDYGLLSTTIEVNKINKRHFKAGVYDLGADFNYPYVKKLIEVSDCIIVPVENSHEVLLKSIATIKYINSIISDTNKVKIFVVFNRLDNTTVDREKKYTHISKELILEHIPKQNIKFFHVRYAFAMYKNQAQGYFFLDNLVKHDKPISLSNYALLQHLRYYTVNKILNTKEHKQLKNATKQKEETEFFDIHKTVFEEEMGNIDISSIYDLQYYNKTQSLIKDMLILNTHIRDTYKRRDI